MVGREEKRAEILGRVKKWVGRMVERERETEAVAKGDEETMASCCFSSSEMDSGVSGLRSLASILVLIWFGEEERVAGAGEKSSLSV